MSTLKNNWKNKHKRIENFLLPENILQLSWRMSVDFSCYEESSDPFHFFDKLKNERLCLSVRHTLHRESNENRSQYFILFSKPLSPKTGHERVDRNFSCGRSLKTLSPHWKNHSARVKNQNVLHLESKRKKKMKGNDMFNFFLINFLFSHFLCFYSQLDVCVAWLIFFYSFQIICLCKYIHVVVVFFSNKLFIVSL